MDNKLDPFEIIEDPKVATLVALGHAVCAEYGINPALRIILKDNQKHSSGVTKFDPNRVTISVGTDIGIAKGILLHELAHILAGKHHHHDSHFYRFCFELFKKYLTKDQCKTAMQGEFVYMKSSKWYAEWYGYTSNS